MTAPQPAAAVARLQAAEAAGPAMHEARQLRMPQQGIEQTPRLEDEDGTPPLAHATAQSTRDPLIAWSSRLLPDSEILDRLDIHVGRLDT